MKMIVQVLFHLFGAVQFFYGCYYDHTYVNFSNKAVTFGGKLKYLTFLNAMLQTIYFTVALLNDIFGSNAPTQTEKPLLRRIKDIMFTTLAFPLSLFVGTTFWGIYIVDRELILPRSLDVIFPSWLNHVMHTNIVFFILIELVASFRMYPTRKWGLSLLSTFMLAYMVWVHIIYFHADIWVYPILTVLNWPLRIIFYLFCLGFVWSLYSLGETLNRIVWNKEIDEIVRSGKKKAK